MALPPSNSGQKVNVFIRVRPLIQREKEAEETVNWYTDDNTIQQCQAGTKKPISSSAPYAFDQIFSEAAETKDVYEKAVAPIVEKSLQGFNGTVLCYGQTSSGKTHTMYGSDKEPGIIFLTAQDLFKRFGDDSRSYLIRIGLLEVYNEKLTDLLDPEKKQIDIKEHKGEATPKGLKEIDVYSPEDMLDAASRVQNERRIGETQMNKESSRSHTILRITIQSRPNDESKSSQVTQALLNFVDLAGSEKAGQTGAVGDRFIEATYINKSLSTLSLVVHQLSGVPTPSNGNHNLNSSTLVVSTAAGTMNAKLPAKQPFVSYRDSKLTRILQSSLSGNAYIALICNVTPASIEETHSTLRFASRAKCIQVDPTKNMKPITASEYRNKISDLEKQLNGRSAEADRLRKQLAAFTKFVQPYMSFSNSPAPFNAQPERRRTMCPSMLFGLRSGILMDQGPGDEFKMPKSPLRRSLMPTHAANSSATNIPALNYPPQRSLLDSSFEINENFLLDEPGPPPAKVAKVDAQTWTEFSPLTALQFRPPNSPAPKKQLEKSLHFDPSQSMIDEIKEEKSFIALERACEVEELSKTCESLQAEMEELRSSNERLQSENEFLQKNLSDAKSRNQKVMSDFERLQEEHLTQADFINEMQDEVGEYKKKLQESEEVLKEVKNGTTEDQEWRDRYEALRAQSDSAVKNLSKERDQLATRVEELFVQLQVAEEVKTNLAEVTKLKDEFQQQVVSIGETLKATECDKVQLELDLATAKESVASANGSLGRLEQLEQQHEVLLRQHEGLQMEATQLRQDNQDNRSELLRFEALKDELEIKYDKTLGLLAIREKELEEKSKAHDILLAELDSLKSELLKAVRINELSSEDFNSKIELLRREKDAIEEESIRAQAECESLSGKLETIARELMTSKQENKELSEKLNGVNEGLVDATGQLEAMQSQIAGLLIELSEVRTLKESSDIQVAELNSQLASIQLELEKVKAQKELAVNEAASLCSKLLTVQEEFNQIKVQYSEVDTKAQEQNEQVTKLSAEVMAANKEREAAFFDLEAQNEKVEKLLVEFASLTKNLEEVKAQKELAVNEAASLSSKLLTLQEELDRTKIQYSEVDAKAQDESEQVTKLSAEIMAANKERDAAFSDLEVQNEKVEKLFAEFESLTKNLEEVKAQKDLAVNEAASLSSKLLTVQKELDRTKIQYSEVDAKAQDQSEQVTKLSAEVVAANKERDAAFCDVEAQNEKVEKILAEFQSLTKNLEEVKAQKDLAVNEAASLSSKLVTLQEELDRTNLQYSEVDAKSQDQSEQVAKLSAEVIAAHKERDAALCDVETQNEKVEKILAEFESLTKKLEESESQLAESGLINASLNEKLDKLKEELEVAQKEISDLEAIREVKINMENQLACLMDQMNSLKNSESDVEKLQASNMELTSEIQRTRQLLEAEKEKLTSSTARANELEETSEHQCSEISDLKFQLENTSDKLATVQLEFASMKSELEASMILRESLTHQIEELESELTALRDAASNVDELRKNNASLMMEIEQVRRDSEETDEGVKAKLDEATKSVDELQSQVKSFQLAFEELKETNANLTEKLASVTSEVDAAKMERDAAQADVTTLESEKEELASEFESLSMKLLGLESEYEIIQEQLANSLQSNDNLQSTIDSLKQKLEAASHDSTHHSQELTEQLASVSAELVLLRQQYEATTIQLSTCKEALARSEAAHESVSEELEALRSNGSTESEQTKTENQELSQQLGSVSAELGSLRQQYESTTIQLQACKDALAQSEAAHESVSKEIEALRSNGCAESEQMKTENHELTQQLASVSAELGSLRQQYESTTIQLQSCKEMLAHSEAAHESISKEIEALRSKSSSESEQMKTENQELLNQLEEASQKVVTMELELLATRKSRESLHSQLATVQEELEVIRSAATGSTDHLSKQCEALQCENESLRAERRAHLVETERMELAHQEVTFKYTKSVEMLSQLEEELEGVKKAKDLLQAELDSSAQVADALSELKKQCEYLRTQINKLEAEKKEHSATIADLTREKETFAAEIQRLQLDLEDKKALKKELEGTKSLVGQLEQLQPQIVELQQGIEMKTKEIEAFTIKLRQSDTSLEIMRTQLASESQTKIDELQLQIQTLQAQVYGEKSGSATLKKTNQQLSERQKTLQSELDELKARYNSLQSTAEAANQKRSTLEQTVATLEARLTQAQQDRPRVSKRSVATQVGDTEDILKQCKEYHIYATRYKYKYGEAVKEVTVVKRELEECKKKNAENEKHIADFTARVVADSELIDSLQEQIRKIPETTEIEVQCDIATEVFTKAKKYILYDIPEGWEDFGVIYKRLCQFKSEASALQLEKSRCKCSKDDDKKTTFGFPGSRLPQGSLLPFQSRSSPTTQPASSVARTQAALGPAVGRPAVLGTPAAVLPAQVISARPTQVTSARPPELDSVPQIQSAQQPVRTSTVSAMARHFEPTASAAATASFQGTRPPAVPSGILSTRPLHSIDDAPIYSNVSKSAEETSGKANISSSTQMKPPDVVAPASKRENGENQPPSRNRKTRINWDEPVLSIEELQKEMPLKKGPFSNS